MKLTKETKELIDNWLKNKTPEEVVSIVDKYIPDNVTLVNNVVDIEDKKIKHVNKINNENIS